MRRSHSPVPATRPSAARLVVPMLLGVLALQGCGRGAPPEAGPTRPADEQGGNPERVVATIGDRQVTESEADALVAGQLHELDRQRYELRRQATEALLLQELGASGADVRTARIRLVPPLPGVVALPGVPAGLRPEPAAPVTVSVFCNFESPHCAAVQSALADLLSLYPDSVRIAARDLPLPMHPRSTRAAEAARCAGRQGRYWQFHDLLWARGRGPEAEELATVGQAIGLDAGSFRVCVETRAEAGAVAADMAVAERLGLGAVPAVFVNGRIVSAPVTPDQIVWLVEEELQRLDAAGSRLAATQPTRLPLVLRATIVGERPGLGLALIGGLQPDSPVAVRREGERVTSDAILRRVGPDGVELVVAGRVETLSFSNASEQGGDTASSVDGEAGAEPAAAVAPPRTSPMPVFLDRELVRERMTDRVALSARLQPVPMTVDGYRLLQLDEVPPGSLYELLGLQAGDVIVAVNEQPIHEGDNPLWDALDREQEVRVRVMRRGGVAQHYTYRF